LIPVVFGLPVVALQLAQRLRHSAPRHLRPAAGRQFDLRRLLFCLVARRFAPFERAVVGREDAALVL